MSDVEQITKEPNASTEKTPKVKDPKKVAAGKKLAESNKKAREAYAREMKREAEARESRGETSESTDITQEGSSESWIPEMSFSTVISLVGLGFTAFQLYMTYGRRSDGFDLQPVTTVFNREPQPTSKIPVPIPPKDTPQDDTPKIGML